MTPFLEFVENKARAECDDNLLGLAVNSIVKSHKRHGHASLSEQSLTNWGVDMLLANLSKATRKRYFGKIHSLFNVWRKGELKDPFNEVKCVFEFNTAGVDEASSSRHNLAQIKQLLEISTGNDDYQTIAIFLYLLYNPETSACDIVNLEFAHPTPEISQLDDIKEAMATTHRTKYMFGLEQGRKRQPQIVRELFGRMRTVLQTNGFILGQSFSRNTITSLWITAALKAGISVGGIRAIVNNIPEDYIFLNFIEREELSESQKIAILQRVADTINDNSSKWHIMHLRTGHTAEDVEKAITRNFEHHRNNITLYYPKHTVMKCDSQGKKRRIEEPYLPGIIFFRIKRSLLCRLFSKIGEHAWCYKSSPQSQNDYCTIPAREMKIFQMHIGKFTPDIQMELVTRDEPLEKGAKVMIQGNGILDGSIGIIKSIKNSNGTRTYSLALSNRDIARWTVTDIEEPYLSPL